MNKTSQSSLENQGADKTVETEISQLSKNIQECKTSIEKAHSIIERLEAQIAASVKNQEKIKKPGKRNTN